MVELFEVGYGLEGTHVIVTGAAGFIGTLMHYGYEHTYCIISNVE
jgi:hypothetical protein